MLVVTADIMLDETELVFRFVRASGPGGQNVNKVATAVQLYFDVTHSLSLTQPVKTRLWTLAGRRISSKGVLHISAQRFRSQERNRTDAVERLIALIKRAAEKPKPRKQTRPTRASKRRRLDGKRHQGDKKRLRRRTEEF